MESTYVNSVLCYVSSIYDDLSSDVLNDIVYSFYNNEAIAEARKVLAGIINKDCSSHRGPHKKKNDLDDLLQYYAEYREGSKKVSFVAENYKDLPPHDFSIVAPILSSMSSHLCSLNDNLQALAENQRSILHEISLLNEKNFKIDNIDKFFTQDLAVLISDVSTIKSTIGTMKRSNQREDLRRMSLLSNISSHDLNTEATAPPVLNELDKSIVNELIESSNVNSSLIDDLVGNIRVNAPPNCDQAIQNNESQLHKINLPRPFNEVVKSPPLIKPSTNKASTYKRPLIVVNSREKNYSLTEKDEDGFTRYVPRSKRRFTITGNRKASNEANLKGANCYFTLYVGRCGEDVTVDNVKTYLQDELNIQVRECIKLKTRVPYSSSFKITVNFGDHNTLLSPESWTEGIICRKFITKKQDSHSQNIN